VKLLNRVSMLTMCAGLFCLPSLARAFTIYPIPYSGTLSESGTPVNGTRYVTLTLYDVPTGGTLLYTQAESLQVVGGVYHTSLMALPSVWSGADRWLGVSINSGPELTPRQAIGWVPYAIHVPLNQPALFTRPATSRTVNGDQWTKVDSLTIVAPTSGIAIINMTGAVQWTGAVSAPGMVLAISTSVPLGVTDNLTRVTSKTDVHSVSPTLMTTVPAGSTTYYLWALVAAVGQSYSVDSRRYQATFIPFN
jgi:hypothetical protein